MLFRSIVTAVAGTTRDLVTERVDVDGLSLTLVDTAGWRETTDVVEQEGVARASKARQVADVVLVVIDGSVPLTVDDEELLRETANRRRVVVLNKQDLSAKAKLPDRIKATHLSALTGAGARELREAIVEALTGCERLRDSAAISNTRHIALLTAVRACLAAARDAAAADATPEEFLLADLQAARTHLDEIVGVRTSDDLLEHIFARFCIGK